jgi:hypothetical protein
MAKAISPNVSVHAPMDRANHQTTAGHHSKSEKHFQKIVDRSVNHADEQERYSAKRKRK